MIARICSNPIYSALCELGLLFLPAIPAYIWIWPNISGQVQELFQIFVYLYILAGTIYIGRRRWNWDQLGINRKGIGLALVCGLVILAARLAIILSINWNVHPAQLTPLRLIYNVLYYFALVGLGEELLFRGLVYRLLLDWKGVRWAIWGSSVGFILWHIFGQGPLIGLAALLIGLLFALLRWRGGGIVGLIVVHALWDLETILLVADSNADILASGTLAFRNLAGIYLGTVLLFAVPLYLWLLHPRLVGWLQRSH